MERYCKVCGVLLAAKDGMGRPREYCDDCRPRHYWRIDEWQRQNAVRVREYQRTRFGERPIREYDCRECGTRSVGYVDDRCPTCRHRANRQRATGVLPLTVARPCKRCGQPFTPLLRNQQRYCTEECQKRHRWGSRLGIPYHLRRKILKRDDWRCYLCDKAIDPALRWPHELSGTVDHVIPYSVCQHNRPDNLRAAHWRCNYDKGDSLPGTEVWVPI